MISEAPERRCRGVEALNGEVASTAPVARNQRPLRLNVGSGDKPLEGYVPIDRKHGGEAFPLRYNDGTPVADGSVDEITASHVLEHFGMRQVEAVVKGWVKALRAGGTLKVAVPDFRHIAVNVLKDKPGPHYWHLFGGQTDEDDFHRSGFDRDSLAALLRACGLTRIRLWEGIPETCSALPCSLNMEGTKGSVLRAKHKPPKVHAVMSLPRVDFTDNTFCALRTCHALDLPFRPATGAYWDQCLERIATELVEEDASLEYVLTIDYDSLYRPQDVLRLFDLAVEHPEADAIAPIQVKRGDGNFMVAITQPDGSSFPDGTPISKEHYKADLTRAVSAHFGLTLLKAEKLRQLPHPWFRAIPNDQGRWDHGRQDADIAFWGKWRDAGNTLYLANRVPIGHLELMAAWPKEGGGVVHQYPSEFWNDLEPEGLWA